MVEASRLQLNQLQTPWGVPEPDFYFALQERLDDLNALKDILIKESKGLVNFNLADVAVHQVLYRGLLGDGNLHALREILVRGPENLRSLSGKVFSPYHKETGQFYDSRILDQALVTLVDLAVQAKQERLQDSPAQKVFADRGHGSDDKHDFFLNFSSVSGWQNSSADKASNGSCVTAYSFCQ